MHASEHMSIWGLVSDASLVVQAVMACLVLASLLSWYLIVQRGWALGRSEKASDGFLQRFRASGDLALLYRESQARTAEGDDETPLQRLFVDGYQAFAQLQRQPQIENSAVLEGVERSLYVSLAEQDERLDKGLAFLATVGSVSPYIGLFGTVWGIMNAFLGLSQVQQATLNTVAPGIAEALIATAIGLFAAIPAVMAYNRFSARGQMLSARQYAFANELQARLHKRLHCTPSMAAVA
ncbi:protein TolQ [Pseudomonas putida]|uniref:Tol-Pal system protein TolQ n=1 Tax=Pseudomonas putida TaxID=303 RepID=A0A1Q9R0A8_PSEPU|nr:protein TolQ [Pseudomonas putida]OLS60841.1 Biopolymer transport protein ExbB [Pseudomonas putida]